MLRLLVLFSVLAVFVCCTFTCKHSDHGVASSRIILNCSHCMSHPVVVDPYTNVSQSQPVRVVDVRGQKLKAPERTMRLLSKGRGEVLPETHSLAMASPQIQNST